MNERQPTELVQKMQQLARSYVPEWKFSIRDPDPGSVVALLCCDMLQESHNRLGKVLHKHKIQYLNLFDRLKDEPIESARTYVRFRPVAGLEEPVPVPKGTGLYAETEESGRRIVFETLHSITATPAALQTVWATDQQQDRIVCLSGSGTPPEQMSFAAFDLSDESCAEHLLRLSFGRALDDLASLHLRLRVLASDEEAAASAAAALGGVSLTLEGPAGVRSFDRVEVQGDSLLLTMEQYTPDPTGADELVFRAETLCPVTVTGFELTLEARELPADQVYCAGVQQNPEHFKPFGSPMEIYAECGIECRELLARRGATAEMSFNLSFEVLEQLLPEYETQTQYKIIMRQPPTPPRPVTVDIKPDYVLLEYCGPNGWRRLIPDEHAALLFNGSEEGTLRLSFTVPQDLVSPEEAPGDARLRLRLLQADDLYRIPARQHCPVIDHLRFAYRYEGCPVLPQKAVTRNNFDEQDVTQRLLSQRSVELFYNHEYAKPAMYLGFDAPVWGTPISLYLEVENNEDHPVDFTVEYGVGDDFRAVKLIDQTAGLLYSGALLLIVPRDIQKRALFGKELYWLRLVRHDQAPADAELPLIKGIYTNMAQVQNLRTRTETFYVDDVDAAVQLQLDEQELLHAAVYVNEAGAPETEDGEHWVRWKKGSYMDGAGRVYQIDLTAGRVSFAKNIFAVYPLYPYGPAIKVEYQSYQGAEANVPAGAIHTISQSLRSISGADNPIGAYGGYDGYNEATSAAIISNMLRTRGRAISERDYFDLISQVSYGVRRIKCRTGIDQYGKPREDAITIAVLIDEYEQGSHIFSAVKDRIRQKLLESSSILPLGKTLILSQPYFVQLSVRLWLQCARMENAYDLQKETEERIREFIDPLHGGFEGKGWEIGTLPTMQQILAYLKIRLPEAVVRRTVLTAHFGRSEHAVNEEIGRHIQNPFAMAVNGEHTIYVDLD